MSDPISLRLALAGRFERPELGRRLISVAIAAQPSPWQRNQVAALHRELEELLGRSLACVGGGLGCVQTYLDPGPVSDADEQEIANLIANTATRSRLMSRFGLGWLSYERV